MKQKILTDDAYKKLVNGIERNRTRYQRNATWLSDKRAHAGMFQHSTINVPKALDLKSPDENGSYDFENAKKIHRFFKNLLPVPASDPRLWSRLAHVECWSYMQARWPVVEEKKVRFVRERYFFAGTDSRSVLRNGISRLWWSAEVTYDAKRKGKEYELTKVLFSKLDIAQTLLEHSFGRAKPLVRCFLEFVVKNKAECLDDGQNSRKRIRHLGAALHAKSGVCVLDTLSKKELQAFLSRELEMCDKYVLH